MKIAYFDCFSGISGDMVLGAFLDMGLQLEALKQELKKLPLDNYRIRSEHVQKQGIWATKVHVQTKEKGVIRTWTNIRNLIGASGLTRAQKEKCLQIFEEIALAEAKIHRRSIDQVHFHEVGATDSIIDIAGTVICLSMLEIEEVYSSALPTGTGFKKIDHGTIPIPAPATLEILKDVPVYSRGIPAELVTPTGAAIIKTLSASFSDFPPLIPQSIGYGAGSHDLEIPNVLRIIAATAKPQEHLDEKLLIETNIDDSTPEFTGYILDKLINAGAKDAWLTPILMKKGRMACKLSVLAPEEKEEEVIRVLFEETNTLGARLTRQQRRILRRKEITVETEFGEAKVKIGYLEKKAITVSPEYEDCARLAAETSTPLKQVFEAAKRAAEKKITP
jgi:uncharacterized protein (TIGR00299 family) protein